MRGRKELQDARTQKIEMIGTMEVHTNAEAIEEQILEVCLDIRDLLSRDASSTPTKNI